MATLLNPFLRALDANADAVSGGLLYVFAAGTTTPVTTYSDSAMATAQAQPLVANSAGEFEGVFVASGTYKIRVADSSGVMLYENDFVRMADRPDDPVFLDNFAAFMADTTDYAEGQTVEVADKGFRYVQAASGATDHDLTRTDGGKFYVSEFANGGLSPEQFGADGGESDNTTAIVAMYAANPATAVFPKFYPVTGNFARADIPHGGYGGVTIGGDEICLNTTETVGDVDFYANTSGSDTVNHGLTSAYAFATPQRAYDSAPLIRGHQQTFNIGAGTFNASSRAAGDMPRPAVLYCQGAINSARTAQDGSDLEGMSVIRGAGATTIIETNPATSLTYGVYASQAEVAIEDLTIRASSSGTSAALLTSHRAGAYVHTLNVDVDSNGASLGAVVESGAYLEAINSSFTGATSLDLLVYGECGASISGTDATTRDIGRTQNSGKLDINGNVDLTTSFLAASGSNTTTAISGSYRPKITCASTFDVGSTATLTNTDIVGEVTVKGVLRLDSCNFTGRIVANGGTVYLNDVTNTGNTTQAFPLVAFNDGKFVLNSGTEIRNNSGVLVGVDHGVEKVRLTADNQVIPFVRDGRTTITDIEMLPAVSAGLTGITLSGEVSGLYSGTPPSIGDIWVIKRYGVYPYNFTMAEGTTGDFGGRTITIGDQSGGSAGQMFTWSPRGFWMPFAGGPDV